MDCAYCRSCAYIFSTSSLVWGRKSIEVDFFRLGAADLLKSKLRLVAINFDAGLDFYEIIAIDVFGDGFK